MQDITLIVDGTQCRIWTPRDKEERQENPSYKFQQKQARNYLVIVFVSQGFGARHHDWSTSDQLNWIFSH